MPTAKDVPQSVESERAILGAVLLNNAAWDQAAKMDPSAFFLDSHRVIFASMKDLGDRGVPVDLVTLAEALHGANALDRIGGAAYLSSLTDGTPKLDNIGHYIQTVQEKSRLRRMMAAGIEIAERAALGDESAVAAIVGTIPASSNGKGALLRIVPEVPETAWCELARRYRNIVGGSTEASDNYHLASYLTVAGAVLGRLIWFNYPFPIYPNFYTALIGASSKARKSTAIRFAYQLGRAVNPELHWLRSVNSSEGMIQLLHDLQEKQHDRSSVSTVLRFGELRSLIDTAAREGTKNIVPVLLEAFEGTDRLERNTVKGVAAEQPNISIIGGLATAWIPKLNLDDLEAGLGNRFLWITGAAKQRMAFPPPANLTPCIMDLAQVLDFWRKIGPTPLTMAHEAEVVYRQWYEEYVVAYNTPLMQAMSGRHEIHCLKVAMLYCGLARRPEINAADIQAGIAFCGFLDQCIDSVFSEYGFTESAKEDAEIIEFVRKRHPLPIPKRQLWNRFKRLGSEVFNKRLLWLTGNDGPLRMEKILNRTCIQWNPEWEE